MDNKDKTLARVVQRVGDLPALPAIVAEVLEMTYDPNIPMSRISDKIQQDPVLTARILKVSNSAYYGMKQYVGTLKLALVILGVREIRNIVMGVSVFQTLRNPRIDSLLTQHFWRHSVLVAELCRKLGAAHSLGSQGEDFISGLLHDIGKMAMLRYLGDDYEPLLRLSSGAGNDLCIEEMKFFGFDHADMAAALAANWNFPKTLTDAVWCHHWREGRDLAAARDPRLAAVVRIANAAVAEDYSSPEAPPGPVCSDEDAWTRLDAAGHAPDVESRRDLLVKLIPTLDERHTALF